MKKRILQKAMFLIALFLITKANAAVVIVNASITSNTTWTSNNLYILVGDIFVKNATLTIEPGTLIKGDKSTLSRLIITTSGKIMANGTATKPIVFTSNVAAGNRMRGDWAGIAMCGLAPINFKDAAGNPIQGRLECGATTDYDYGGNDANHSSGEMSYVRIEYAGYVCGANSELNSLTLGGVGAGTKLHHIQVSFGQDDGFEFFGGTVNADHLISYGSRDDDFDTDNGFSGKLQFGVAIRIDTIADQGDISNAFESDNDANGTTNTPNTAAVFSNFTIIGPAEMVTSTIDAKYGWAFRLRRNTSLSVFNTIVLGYKRGLRLEGTATQSNATADLLEFKNNIIAGCKEQAYETAFDSAYLADPMTMNTVYGGNANDSLKLVAPYGSTMNFLLQATSPALTGASFTNPKLATGFTPVAYKGAFGATDNWAADWTNFNPQNTPYLAPTGIEETIDLNAMVATYPNPAYNLLTIEAFENTTTITELKVIDLTGKVLIEKINIGAKNTIDIDSLATGIYIIKATINGNNLVGKFIKE